MFGRIVSCGTTLLYRSSIAASSSRQTHSFCTTLSYNRPRSYSSTTTLGKQQLKMLIQFKCKICSTTQCKQMSKQAYTTGLVIITCEGCKNKHLIADNLGWYDSLSAPPGNIEDIIKAKGGDESVVRLTGSDPLAIELISSFETKNSS